MQRQLSQQCSTFSLSLYYNISFLHNLRFFKYLYIFNLLIEFRNHPGVEDETDTDSETSTLTGNLIFLK